jgi:hypothetical protein
VHTDFWSEDLKVERGLLQGLDIDNIEMDEGVIMVKLSL